MRRVLLVLGEPEERIPAAGLFARHGWEVTEAGSVREAKHLLREEEFHLILAEGELRDGRGTELLRLPVPDGTVRALLGDGSPPPDHLHRSVVLVTRPLAEAWVASVGVAPGAGDPRQVDRVQTPGRAEGQGTRRVPRMETDSGEGRTPGPSRLGAPSLLGESAAMLRVKEQVRRMGPAQAGVLITGETGTGKEVVALALHRASPRQNGPFVAVNCGAISPSLVESELFGHERGSFTGATRQHRGVFEQAEGGTLLLDEITEMPATLQVRLLRVLEEGEIVRVGGEARIPVDCRVLAASNRDPLKAVEEGHLREDLYYRLNVLRIHLPPLRDRPADILPMANSFLKELREEDGAPGWDKEVGEILQSWPWPGNCRELRNVIEAAHCLSGGELLTVADLPDELRTGTVPVGHGGASLQFHPGTTVDEAEKRLILATLEKLEGHKTRAAKVLGISLKTLYNRLHEYGYPLGPLAGEEKIDLLPA
jgi:DNA-binding NtrC family response regulator